MAIKSIHLTNFRKFSDKQIELYPKFNFILGANGVGKTTIREAICFGFLGTDSAGTRNPTHLIQNGKGVSSVTINTDKASILRELPSKGTGAIKLLRGGVTSKVTQSELEGMLGSPDLFLSVLVPGYFIDLPEQKKQKVLSEVLPPVDRYALLAEMVGFALTQAEHNKYDLSKRSDLVINVLATDRRAQEREISRLEGQVTVLRSVKSPPIPKQPEGMQRLDHLKQISTDWGRYHVEMQNWQRLEGQMKRQVIDNELNSNKERELKAALESFKHDPPNPAPVNNSEEIQNLVSQMKRAPKEPIALQITNMEVCSSCGQIVGAKHRERIQDENRRLSDQYGAELQEVKSFNTPLLERVSFLEQEEDASRLECSKNSQEIEKVRSHRETLLNKLQEVKQTQIMVLPPLPERPSQEFDEAEMKRLQGIQDNYTARVTEYNYANTQREKANNELSGYVKRIQEIANASKRVSVLEAAVKELPVKELRKQSDMLKMPTVEMVMGEKISVAANGVPYNLLSTGNKMRACVEISVKLNSLSKRGPNIIFLDDADLVDECKFDIEGIQLFITNVMQGESLTIKGD